MKQNGKLLKKNLPRLPERRKNQNKELLQVFKELGFEIELIKE